jgi:hypothetical protein
MDPQSIPYGLRIMTKNLRKNPKSMNIIFSSSFIKIKELLLANIDTFNGLDMADILHFARTVNFYKKDVLSSEEKSVLVSKVDQLIEQHELTARQVFSVFSDFAKLKTNINSLERAAADMMQNNDIAMSLADIKTVLQGLDVNLHKTYFRSIRSAILRLKALDLAQVQTFQAIEVLEEVYRHSSVYPFASIGLYKLTQELVNRIDTMHESELLRLLTVHTKVEVSSGWLLSTLFNSLKDRLSADPTAFTVKFYGGLCNLLLELKKVKYFIPDNFVSIVAESALGMYRTECPSDLEIVKVVDLLAVCRAQRDEGKVAELVSLLSQDPKDDFPLSKFVLLNALTAFNSTPASTVLEVDKTRAAFLSMSFFSKVQALFICSQNPLDKPWADLIAELEEAMVLEVESCSYPEVNNSVTRMINYPEVLYSKVALTKLKAAVSSYTDLPEAPTKQGRRHSQYKDPPLLRSVERTRGLPVDCLEQHR